MLPVSYSPSFQPAGSIITFAQQANACIEFIDEHPGGSKILKRVAGKDASKQFWKYHNEHVLKKYTPKLKVGTVKEGSKL